MSASAYRYQQFGSTYGRYLAEAITAFTLVFGGCGAIVIDGISRAR
jgi:hypothetical protein